ncbi:MAG: fumarate reductase/succinate dehydrogenase flavoprotein subunit [Verrucomicrobia bacterium]|nr:fumarate reductase/succinate dehydrogenase flavoprotein subunit [Verrucomicrobiota bacterium]
MSAESKYETHEYDVLVIGAGGAGLRAAIEASAMGARTALVCKSLLGKAHTVMAEGGIAAAMANVDPQDGWETHFKDTMRGGVFVNNWRMAQLHAQQAPDRVRELERWGAVFDRTHDGKILQRAFGGHTYRRLVHVGDRTGLEMIRTLQEKGVHQGIDVFMECAVTRLLKDGDRIAGAFAYWRETGRYVIFKSKAVVLCTGGIGKAYKITSNSWEYTGDGQALAYHAGAELLDMEFLQFHPTGMVWPPGVSGLLVTESVRGDGGQLRNNKGERFMFKHIPDRYKPQISETEAEANQWIAEIRAGKQPTARKPAELLPRDIVARGIYMEVKEGRGSPHGGVFLDISHMPAEYVKKKLPSMYHQFKDLADVDITREPMEVGPTTHYIMGGIRVNPDTQESAVPGLFAAGEAAGGLHGANRLGGNSLSDLLVFGKLAGEHAAQHAKTAGPPKVDDAQADGAAREMNEFFTRADGENPYQIHAELQDMMQSLVGIFRVEDELRKSLEKLATLKNRAARVCIKEGNKMFNPGWHLCKDLQNMILIAEAVARAAQFRKESRGAHSRLDHPGFNPEFAKVNTVAFKGRDGAMQLEGRPLPEMPAELKQLIETEKNHKERHG